MDLIYEKVSEQFLFGATTVLNYPATVISIFIRYTAVEHVNAYLKEFFQLNNVRYHTGKQSKVHFDIITFIYNASKLAVDRINHNLSEQVA